MSEMSQNDLSMACDLVTYTLTHFVHSRRKEICRLFYRQTRKLGQNDLAFL